MTNKVSAGLLMYKDSAPLELFLIHPGGPFFKNKDNGFWGIPKGEVSKNEDIFEAAKREFLEETGIVPTPPFLPLGKITQKNGKVVHAWAFRETDGLHLKFKSNLFKMEWPPKSGRFQLFPEADKASFFTLPLTQEKMMPEQFELVERLTNILKEKHE